MPVLSANMSARAVALWIQFMLLKRYVFKSKAGLSIFAAYVAYVFFTGYVSSAMQVQFTEQVVNSPLLAKIVVELLIWIFNFMFLRDIIFRRWSEACNRRLPIGIAITQRPTGPRRWPENIRRPFWWTCCA